MRYFIYFLTKMINIYLDEKVLVSFPFYQNSKEKLIDGISRINKEIKD